MGKIWRNARCIDEWFQIVASACSERFPEQLTLSDFADHFMVVDGYLNGVKIDRNDAEQSGLLDEALEKHIRFFEKLHLIAAKQEHKSTKNLGLRFSIRSGNLSDKGKRLAASASWRRRVYFARILLLQAIKEKWAPIAAFLAVASAVMTAFKLYFEAPTIAAAAVAVVLGIAAAITARF